MGLPFDIPAPFTTGTEISGYDLNLLRQAAITLDGLSYRRYPANVSTLNATDAPGKHPVGPWRLYQGAIQYRTGMTTLEISGYHGPAGSGILTFYANGVSLGTRSTAGWFTVSYGFTGYAVGYVVPIEIWVSGETTKNGEFSIQDVRAGPITLADAWPGVPTFGTSYSAANGNQLRSACDWLLRRIDAVPVPITPALVWAQATHKVEQAILGTWHVLRAHTEDRLRVRITANIVNAEERLVIVVAGTTVYTGATWTPGVYRLDLLIDISAVVSVGVWGRTQIIADTLLAGNQDPRQTVNSRYLVEEVSSEPATTYPAASPPTAFPENGAISQANLTSRLNAIGTMLTNVYNRITALPILWNWQHATRWRQALDDTQNSRWSGQYIWRTTRRGDRLRIQGKNVKIGWGSTPIVETTEEGPQWSTYTFAHSEQIVNADAIKLVDVFYDTLPGLVPGAALWLTGDVYYAADHLLEAEV